jgi:hypothetical protein
LSTAMLLRASGAAQLSYRVARTARRTEMPVFAAGRTRPLRAAPGGSGGQSAQRQA